VTPFALGTLQTGDGPKDALEVDGVRKTPASRVTREDISSESEIYCAFFFSEREGGE
jgi:hypothetical protein